MNMSLVRMDGCANCLTCEELCETCCSGIWWGWGSPPCTPPSTEIPCNCVSNCTACISEYYPPTIDSVTCERNINYLYFSLY